MDESHWMKCTNTRHLSPLVMYKYPNYCLLSSCSFSSYLMNHILTGTSILQFCSFCLRLSLPVAHHPLCFFSIIFGLLPLTLLYLWLSQKHKNKAFACFVFLCNEICTPGWEAHFQLHFSQNNWLWPKCI